MSLSSTEQQRLSELIHQVRLGQPLGDQSVWLRELLLREPEARKLYAESMWLSGTMRLLFTAADPASPLAGPKKPQRSPVLGWLGSASAINRPLVWSICGCGMLFCMYVGVLVWGIRNGKGLHGTVSDEQPIAKVQRSDDVRWAKATIPKDSDESIESGELLAIESGLVELQLRQGTTLGIEGPAEWSIDGTNRATLKRGKLIARVPRQAIGFTLQTPSTKIVDLGTEFGVTVDESGDSEVHVLRGLVEAIDSSGTRPGTPQRVVAGNALRIDARGGVPRKIAVNPKLFAAAVPTISPRVTLLGFYPFDGDALDASGNKRDATNVAGVTFANGFEGQAASFAGTAASVIELPIDVSVAAVPDLTWGAWVKPAGQIVTRSEILSSDDGEYDRILTIDHRRGMVSEERFGFAASCGPNIGIMLSKGPLPNPARWTFVAGVYRSALRMALLYVEDPSLAGGKGGLVTDIASDVSIGASHGKVFVGNHAVGKEPFTGSIDNAFIIRGALGYPELDAIRTAGAKKILELARPAQTIQP